MSSLKHAYYESCFSTVKLGKSIKQRIKSWIKVYSNKTTEVIISFLTATDREYEPLTKVAHSQNQYMTLQGKTDFVGRYRYLHGDLLQSGFFAPQRKPYVPVGTVHRTDSMVLNATLPRIRNRVRKSLRL